LTRLEAAALKTEAELYTPTGAFLKSSDTALSGYVLDGNTEKLQLRGMAITYSTFRNREIGIKIFSDGRISI